tara:strand:+ start:417 stop:701 length:285 start_codon:yes stop_codon:yes gene_type:complete
MSWEDIIKSEKIIKMDLDYILEELDFFVDKADELIQEMDAEVYELGDMVMKASDNEELTALGKQLKEGRFWDANDIVENIRSIPQYGLEFRTDE